MATHQSLPAPIDAEKRQKAREIFFAGETNCSEIARQVSLSESTVRAWCNREQWRDQIKVSKANPDMDAETRLAIVKSGEIFPPTDMDLAEKQADYTEKMSDAAIRLANHVATLDGEQMVRSADKLLKSDALARKALKLEQDRPNQIIQIGVLCQPQQTQKRDRSAHPSVSLRNRKE